MFQNKKNVQFM